MVKNINVFIRNVTKRGKSLLGGGAARGTSGVPAAADPSTTIWQLFIIEAEKNTINSQVLEIDHQVRKILLTADVYRIKTIRHW